MFMDAIWCAYFEHFWLVTAWKSLKTCLRSQFATSIPSLIKTSIPEWRVEIISCLFLSQKYAFLEVCMRTRRNLVVKLSFSKTSCYSFILETWCHGIMFQWFCRVVSYPVSFLVISPQAVCSVQVDQDTESNFPLNCMWNRVLQPFCVVEKLITVRS